MEVNNICAIYVRYSGEDSTDKKGTNSIKNQIELTSKYANDNNFKIYKIYSDYFKTGTNFDRPGIKELFKDMKNNKFKIIIVKDLSRFSRNYREAGSFFENELVIYNLRFISILDKYDSLHEDELLPIRNYFNTMYSNDLKKKIRNHISLTSKEKPINKIPKYGYIKDDEGNFIIDDESAKIVRLIFKLANDNMNPDQISKYLTNNKIYSPSFYKAYILCIPINKDMENVLSNPFKWNATQVRNILRDIEYCGHSVNLSSDNLVSKDKNIILRNTHEAIIDEEYFNNTPKFISNNKPRQRNYLNQLLRCKCSNRALAYSNSGSYTCPICHKKIKSDLIEDILYNDAVALLKEISLNKDKTLKRFIELFSTGSINKLEKEKANLTNELMLLIKNRSTTHKKTYESKLKKLNSRLEAINKELIDLAANRINEDELKHKFNLFVDSLDTLIPDKLTLIKLAIGNVVVNINDIKNIELDIKYIFTI